MAVDQKLQNASGRIRAYAFRLLPHNDVKKSIFDFARKNKMRAGCVLSAVGSLEQSNIRYANQIQCVRSKGFVEVLSLTGTFSETSAHLHISVADATGHTTGGHLLGENLVYTTMEIVVGELQDCEFVREKDSAYGYDELVVRSVIQKNNESGN